MPGRRPGWPLASGVVLNRLDLRGRTAPTLTAGLPRPDPGGEGPVAAVRAIVADVRARGDAALREYTERFDGVRARRPPGARRRGRRPPSTRRRPSCAPPSRGRATPSREFHEAQLRPDHTFRRGGITVRGRSVPVDRAGCYVPGGRGSLPVDGAHDRGARPGGRRARGRAVRPARPRDGRVATVHAGRGRPRRGRRGVRRRRRPGHRRDGLRHRDDPRPSTSSSARATSTSPWPSARSPAWSACPSAFAGPSEIVVVADATAPGRLRRHRPHRAGRARPRRPGLARHLGRARSPTRSTPPSPRSSPRRRGAAEIERHARRGRLRVLVDGPERRHGRGQPHRPRAPRAHDRRPRGARAAGAQRRRGVLRPAGARPPSATTSPGPATCCPPSARARFGSALTVDDFLKHVHVVDVDRAGFAAARRRSCDARRGRGPRRPRRVRPPPRAAPGRRGRARS